MKLKILSPLFIILILNGNIFSQYILTLPIGTRSLGMGGTGYAIANDGTATFFNPAILGMRNPRFYGGEAQYFREPMIFDVVRSYYSLNWQHQQLNKFGFSVYSNQIDGGNSDVIDTNRNVIDSWHTIDISGAIGIGYCFYKNNILTHSTGIAAKYYRSSIISEQDGEKYHGYALSYDLGYLLQIIDKFRLGIVIKNLGPRVNWKENDSTTDKIGQTSLFAAGIGYIDNFDHGKLKVLTFSIELSFRKFIDESYGLDKDKLLTGFECNLFNTIQLRSGYNRFFEDELKSINEFSFGTGISLFNHFNVDIFWSFDDDGFEIDDPQYGFSISMTRILEWNKKDKKWWRKF